jgi:hypothetical protein
MSETYNIYCDESCHLEHDDQKSMALGALWCPSDRTGEIAGRIREIKSKHGIGRYEEVKWKRVSPAKTALYVELINYFFDDDHLCFRGLVVCDKSKLDHEAFRQTHDDWYYKMYFLLLSPLLNPQDHYRIYLDIKDTKGGTKVRRLHDVLCNTKYDFSHRIIERIQLVRSHEVELFQIADLLIGALSYANRGLNTSSAKLAVVDRMRKRSGYSLLRNTLIRERKLNLFCWEPSRASGVEA